MKYFHNIWINKIIVYHSPLNVLKYLLLGCSFGFDKAPLQFAIVGFLRKNSTKGTELKVSKLFSNFKRN